jgi:hypothetical protein
LAAAYMRARCSELAPKSPIDGFLRPMLVVAATHRIG